LEYEKNMDNLRIEKILTKFEKSSTSSISDVIGGDKDKDKDTSVSVNVNVNVSQNEFVLFMITELLDISYENDIIPLEKKFKELDAGMLMLSYFTYSNLKL
jgi:hypothetical protein